MAPKPRPLPPFLGGQFTVQDALASGATRRRMRSSDLEHPFRGVRRSAGFIAQRAMETAQDEAPYTKFRAERQRLTDDARAYRGVMPAGSFFCGRTAACVGYGLPVLASSLLDVAVFAPRRCPRATGIKGRKVAPHLATVVEIDGLPMTTAASTWAMLGRELPLDELVAIGDAIVNVPRDGWGAPHPELAHASIAELADEIAVGPRPPSTQKLRTAIELIRVGSSSTLETRIRLDCATARLPDPSLDVEIRDRSGRLLGISEIVYERYGVIVEVEGDHHRTERAQWNRDIDKYQNYAEAGWEVVRLTAQHIRGPRPDAVERIARALRRHGWEG